MMIVQNEANMAGLLRMKTDSSPKRLRRGCKFPDGIKDRSNLLIVAFQPLLQLHEFLRKFPMSGQNPPELDEGPHDGDVDLNSPLTVQNTGEHRDTLFREHKRKGTSTAVLRA